MAEKRTVGTAFRRAVGEPPVIPEVRTRPAGISVMLNERRRRVFLTVLDRPGIHLRELARSLGIPLQSLSWHVEILKRSGLLESTRVGKFACLSIPGQVDGAMLRDLALLDIVKNAAIIKVLLRRARTRSQVSTDLKVYPQALDPSLKNLFVRGLIGRHPARVEFEIGPRMLAILDDFRSTTALREAQLLDLLEHDGLQPAIVGREDSKLDIEISGARKRIRIHAYIVPHVLRALA